jgi:hypothetical protein
MPPNGSLGALFLGTFTVAFLHALIPSHWLTFALVGRSQRWSSVRTLKVAALAGSGHVLMTVLLGCLVAVLGKGLLRAIPPPVEHAATAGLLIALGAYFLWSAVRGGHAHYPHSHDEMEHEHDADGGKIGRLGRTPTVMGTLVLGMTLSPCLDLLSVYVAASLFSWQALLLISLLMAATTLTVMLLLIWLTLHGLQRLNLAWLDKNEGIVMGSLLIALGVLLFFL